MDLLRKRTKKQTSVPEEDNNEIAQYQKPDNVIV